MSWPAFKPPSSPKGKEKAEATRLNVLSATLEVADRIMSSGLDTSTLCVEKVASKVCDVLKQRLFFGEEENETDELEFKTTDDILLKIFGQVKALLERQDVGYFNLRQVIAQMVVENGEKMVEWFLTPESKSTELRVRHSCSLRPESCVPRLTFTNRLQFSSY
jgi:hypothetical protein